MKLKLSAASSPQRVWRYYGRDWPKRRQFRSRVAHNNSNLLNICSQRSIRFVHKLPVQCFIINGNESSQEEAGIFIFCLPYIAICIKLKAIEKVILHFCYVLSFNEMGQTTYSLEQLFLLHFFIGIINLHFIMFFMLSIINLLCFTLVHCNIDDIELLV